MYFYVLEDNIHNMVEEYIEKAFEQTTPKKCGLDRRCTPTIFINTNERKIAVSQQYQEMLNYYGGFEYVDSEAVHVMGDYVIYDGEMDDRVERAINRFESQN